MRERAAESEPQIEKKRETRVGDKEREKDRKRNRGSTGMGEFVE